MTNAEESNRKVIHDAFEAWHDGTGAISDVFAPDMVWRIEGHSVVSREYRTAQEFVDEVLAPFAARFADRERFRPVRVRTIHADGDTAIVVWDGHGVANDGRPYDNSYAWVMKMRDGKVIDGTAFYIGDRGRGLFEHEQSGTGDFARERFAVANYDSLSFNDLWQRVDPR